MDTKQKIRSDSQRTSIDLRQSPATWINLILQSTKSQSNSIVEQHLVSAKLQRRFESIPIPNHLKRASDAQTARSSIIVISKMVYHVTGLPSRDVVSQCKTSLQAGLHPILIVPKDQEIRARILAQEEGLEREISIFSIENFVAMNIIELATEENKDFVSVLREIVDIYNKRLTEVETDVSLQIEIR